MNKSHNPFNPIPSEDVRASIEAFLDYQVQSDATAMGDLLNIPGVYEALEAYYRDNATTTLLEHWANEQGYDADYDDDWNLIITDDKGTVLYREAAE